MAAPQTTPQKSAAKRSTAKAAGAESEKAIDAVALLKAQHRQVEGWFEEFEKSRSDAKKAKLVEQILTALKVHTQIEEEIFYPVSRDYLNAKDEEMVDEALVEHASAKNLMREIETMAPGDDLYDAKIKVLSELIEHHVKEEEKEYFPKTQKTDMDMALIGAKMKARNDELTARLNRAPVTDA